MIKICAISDTHNQHQKLDLPEGVDILLHAGDFTGSGKLAEVKSFLEWFSNQNAKHKILISGNHDWMSQEHPSLFKEVLKEYPGVIYLEHEMVEVMGLKIWGRPTSPEFGGWAFMADRGSPKMRSTLSVIPLGIDILLTHGPAAGILDACENGEKVGCEDLLYELERIQPFMVVCGHIHASHGMTEVNGITHINAAILDDRYKMVFEPIIFELHENS